MSRFGRVGVVVMGLLCYVLAGFLVHAEAAAPGQLAMADSAYAPTVAQARAAGVDAWGGYLPGVTGWTYHAWSLSDFAGVQAAGLRVLPIFVGRQRAFSADNGVVDGQRAAAQLQAYQLPAVVALDVEYGAYAGDPYGAVAYVRAWSSAVRAFHDRALVYAPLGLARRLDVAEVDGVWLSYWTGRPMDPDAGPLNPGEWVGRRGIQWEGGHVVDGVDVDSSTVDVGLVAAGAGVPANPGRQVITYRVHRGDTLSAIAARFHVAGGWRRLYRDNRRVVGRNPNLIRPGQTLVIP